MFTVFSNQTIYEQMHIIEYCTNSMHVIRHEAEISWPLLVDIQLHYCNHPQWVKRGSATTQILTSEYITLDICAPMPISTAPLHKVSSIPSRQQLVGMRYICSNDDTPKSNTPFPALLYVLPAQSRGPVTPQQCNCKLSILNLHCPSDVTPHSTAHQHQFFEVISCLHHQGGCSTLMKRAVSTFLQILEIIGVYQLDCCHHAQHCINTNVKSQMSP